MSQAQPTQIQLPATLAIDTPTFLGIADYLASRPWAETNNLMAGVQATIAANAIPAAAPAAAPVPEAAPAPVAAPVVAEAAPVAAEAVPAADTAVAVADTIASE